MGVWFSYIMIMTINYKKTDANTVELSNKPFD